MASLKWRKTSPGFWAILVPDVELVDRRLIESNSGVLRELRTAFGMSKCVQIEKVQVDKMLDDMSRNICKYFWCQHNSDQVRIRLAQNHLYVN